MPSKSHVIFSIFVLVLLSSRAWAGPYDAWSDPDISLVFEGRGVESGPVLEMSVENKGSLAKDFQLPQFTVLVPLRSDYAPLVVETKGGWSLPPGKSLSRTITAFSLDHSKATPKRGESIVYRGSGGGESFQLAQYALQKSLQFERERGFQASGLRPEHHRILVIQRVIWCAFGKNNPKTPMALQQDLSAAYQATGQEVNANSVRGVAESVWADVQRVYEDMTRH